MLLNHDLAVNQKKIVYLLDHFPVLSETFVLQEILELQRQGRPLQVFSLFQPAPAELASGDWSGQIPVVYLSRQSKFGLIAAATRRFLKSPGRFLRTASLTLKHHSLSAALSYLLDGAFVAEQLGHQQIAHLHAHFASGASSVAQIVHQLTNIPYSVMTHAYDIYLARPTDLAYKMSMAHFFATCSHYNQEHLQKLVEPRIGEHIHTVYCGLNLDLFPEQSVDAAPVTTEAPIILAVGRLVEKKGLLYLVLACGLLKEQGYRFTCRIIGNGPQRLLIEQKIQELGLSEHLELIGAATHEQVIEMYQQATIVALPCIIGNDGDRDGIPNVLMEALYMQKAVISTPVSGIPELISDEENGLLVAPRDARALATALARLLDDPILRHRLGEAGRETILERFTVQKTTHRLMTLFTDSPLDFSQNDVEPIGSSRKQT